MSQTADRYAQALFDLAQEQDNLQEVYASLTEVKSLMLALEDFRRFLSNPLLSFEERETVLKALFEGKTPDIVCRFLLFITYKHRLNILEDIIESFDGLYLSAMHQLRFDIQTAFPVNEEDKIFINQHLKDKFHQTVISRWDLNPSLLGGFRIYIKGWIYDYSFKSQLNHFLQQTTQQV